MGFVPLVFLYCFQFDDFLYVPSITKIAGPVVFVIETHRFYIKGNTCV
jgi:hypothetical protein